MQDQASPRGQAHQARGDGTGDEHSQDDRYEGCGRDPVDPLLREQADELRGIEGEHERHQAYADQHVARQPEPTRGVLRAEA